jgi:hypothetical protein
MNSLDKDIQLINRMLLIASALDNNGDIVKTASVVDSIKSILSDMTGAVKDRVEKEGLSSALIDYMTLYLLPGKLKLFGALFTYIGLSPSDFFKMILGTAKKTIDQKGSYSQEDADSDLDKILSQVKISSSIDDNVLNKYSDEGNLHTIFKTAKPKRRGPGNESSNPIIYLMQMLSKSNQDSFLRKIFKLITKVVLAGLVGVAIAEAPTAAKSVYENAVKPAVGLLPSSSDDKKELEPSESLPSKKPHNLISSGKGQEVHVNSGNTFWYVKLIDGNIPKTLIYWAENVYPELKGYGKEIASTDSFNKLALIMSKYLNQEELPYYIMPQYDGLHTLKDVVDIFAGEAAEAVRIKG